MFGKTFLKFPNFIGIFKLMNSYISALGILQEKNIYRKYWL